MPYKKLTCPCEPRPVASYRSEPTIGSRKKGKEAWDVAVERATEEAQKWADKEEKYHKCPSKYPNCCESWYKVVVAKDPRNPKEPWIENLIQPYKKGDTVAVIRVHFELLVLCKKIECPEIV